MENTVGNKEKFFAQYYNQFIVGEHSNKATTARNEFDNFDINDAYLKLKPLSAISDEDAIEYFDILFGGNESHKNKPIELKIDLGKSWAEALNSQGYGLVPKNYINGIDFLRSKEYSLPFHDLTVEQQIEYGWIKLTNQ